MITNRQKALAKEIGILIPSAPFSDCEPIKAATSSPHMKRLPLSIAVWLATVAHIRHRYTDYDLLRDEGYDKDSARFFVLEAINDKLTEWRATRFLSADEEIE